MTVYIGKILSNLPAMSMCKQVKMLYKMLHTAWAQAKDFQLLAKGLKFLILFQLKHYKILSIPSIQTLGNPPVLGSRPVKTVEDPWKPLSCRSSCPVKNSCREPLYGDSYVEKIMLGPVKVLEDQQNLDFPCGYHSSAPVKAQKFSRCLQYQLKYGRIS